MITITLEEVTKDKMKKVQEIVLSNKIYNALENGKETRSMKINERNEGRVSEPSYI
ncbi:MULTISPECIES: hypothetical protein [Bacillaceae]|uniref:hypothetical protein n=1 Tax=Bacillaceae TaxID=186817 RepID=UPI00159B963A|nr:MULTISPECIES: hypothetical protein [Bacillaceae]UGB30842.1 hypothetical protein LPC09_24665 [Metabacillus sp. B2-18]